MCQEWKPQPGRLHTRWAKDVSPTNARPEYPRPQMARKRWMNLNGLWDYAITGEAAAQPSTFDGKILVPFPVESSLSGVMKKVTQHQRLWYRHTFVTPTSWNKDRLLLHFGAVDWDTTVWVNGKEIGRHIGGYDPFTFDITDALKQDGAQEIVVKVYDPSNTGTQPIGKQALNPEGIWYTPTTGIWQTAWLEPVPANAIQSLVLTPDIDKGELVIKVNGPTGEVKAVALDGMTVVGEAKGHGGSEFRVKVPNAKLWTPDSPFLYKLDISSGKDKVSSYFAMRSTGLGKDKDGITRLLLNGKPIFMNGPLDQGFWPDGLYTAPTEEAMVYDVKLLKKLGYNMLRKHVKVEPDTFYYWCDKLGMMVWQDMPSGWCAKDDDAPKSPEIAAQYLKELFAMIDAYRNHPSIVMWIPFNEGWGQHDTVKVTNMVKKYDPSRLVNNASGWTDKGAGDVIDWHVYPGPGSPQPEAHRAAVLGEFGGLGLPVKGHTWQEEANWGYRTFDSQKALTEAFVSLYVNVRHLVGDPGLCAAVYTQTTDVEVEVNGIMTYDREVIKVDEKKVAEAIKRSYVPGHKPVVVVPTSETEGQEWHWTTDAPAEGWNQTKFDDSSWKVGPGGFGTKETPGSVVRTEWNTPDIWIRRTFEVPKGFNWHEASLRVHHDEDAEIYIDGVLVDKLSGFGTTYANLRIAQKPAPGKHVIAIHCKQTRGGQYIDAGILDLINK